MKASWCDLLCFCMEFMRMRASIVYLQSTWVSCSHCQEGVERNPLVAVEAEAVEHAVLEDLVFRHRVFSFVVQDEEDLVEDVLLVRLHASALEQRLGQLAERDGLQVRLLAVSVSELLGFSDEFVVEEEEREDVDESLVGVGLVEQLLFQRSLRLRSSSRASAAWSRSRPARRGRSACRSRCTAD